MIQNRYDKFVHLQNRGQIFIYIKHMTNNNFGNIKKTLFICCNNKKYGSRWNMSFRINPFIWCRLKKFQSFQGIKGTNPYFLTQFKMHKKLYQLYQTVSFSVNNLKRLCTICSSKRFPINIVSVLIGSEWYKLFQNCVI